MDFIKNVSYEKFANDSGGIVLNFFKKIFGIIKFILFLPFYIVYFILRNIELLPLILFLMGIGYTILNIKGIL